MPVFTSSNYGVAGFEVLHFNPVSCSHIQQRTLIDLWYEVANLEEVYSKFLTMYHDCREK